jgi:hypothetical protein
MRIRSPRTLRLPLQRDIPMHVVRYHIKPLGLEDEGYGMRIKSFQVDVPPLKREANGFHLLSMEKVPAFRAEPHMPPEDQVPCRSAPESFDVKIGGRDGSRPERRTEGEADNAFHGDRQGG